MPCRLPSADTGLVATTAPVLVTVCPLVKIITVVVQGARLEINETDIPVSALPVITCAPRLSFLTSPGSFPSRKMEATTPAPPRAAGRVKEKHLAQGQARSTGSGCCLKTNAHALCQPASPSRLQVKSEAQSGSRGTPATRLPG